MEILEMSVDELIPYENNPRNNDMAVSKVAESIREFGFKVPIIIDKDNVIVAGHTRLKAAKQLGIDKVPCIMADDLSEEQIKAFRLADNKVSEFSAWDFDALEKELAEIESIDMSDFGFNLDDSSDDEMEDIDDEGLGDTMTANHKMMIDKTRIELTDEEYEAIMKKLDNYVDINGVVFGFVRWLLND